MLHGYSDRIHHALAFTVKHFPVPVSRYDSQSCLIRASSVAVILARYGAEEATIVAGVLKQLADACPPERQQSLARDVKQKFGDSVAATVSSAVLPRFDVLGRTRTWKACRFEYLAQLAAASPRAVDVSVADELHCLGAALVTIRRLGVEYVEADERPHHADTRWWLPALSETIRRHPTWRRPEMVTELDRMWSDLNERLDQAGW